jgi:hypothetical protein
VQCTRTITLSKVITELLPFVTFLLLFFVRSITWKLLVGIQNNFIQWSSTIRGSSVHKNRNSILTNYTPSWLLQSYCPLLFLLVRSITWKLMVGIQYNFIQSSSTLRGSAVHMFNNTIWQITELFALWYFSLSGA